MNRRRWTAVALAGALFIVGAMANAASASRVVEDESSKLNGINQLLYGSNELEEKIITQGDGTKRIVRLTVDGAIVDSGSSGGGIFASEGYNHQLFLRQLTAIAEDPTIAGVLLEVNSPGGGVYESAEIARALRAIQAEDKALYVSMKNTAASGGYYIAASADKIFAAEETVTGSIGVIVSSLNYSGLLEKLGVEDSTYKSGALKDMGSGMKKTSPEEAKVFQTFVDNSYNRFVKVVAEGRELSEERVRELADGRIYDGQQAKENGLVDAIGYPDEALAALQKEQKLSDATVFEYDVSTTRFASSWIGAKLAEVQGLKPSETTRMLNIVESIGTNEAPKPLYYYGGA